MPISRLIPFIFFVVSLISNELYSQDVHYSQRLVQDRERNPTFLSHFEGKWQAYSTYRQQWSSVGQPFVTQNFHLTRKIRMLQGPVDYFVGIGVTNDQSGDVDLQMNQIALHFGANINTTFGLFEAALSNQWVNKSLNLNGVTFPEQYDRSLGRFNENLANSENLNSQSLSFFNFNFGLAWTKVLNEKWKLRSGVSLQNILEPEESFLNGANRKNRGWGTQFLANYKINEKKQLEPYLSLYRASGASETIIGSALRIERENAARVKALKPLLYFRTGIGRTTDALIIGGRAQILAFDLGLSYDVNVSSLELASNYQGGFEISLFYTLDYLRIKERTLPCVRY